MEVIKKNIFRIASVLSREKGIEERIVSNLLVESIKVNLSLESNLDIDIVLSNNNINIYTIREVVESPESIAQISLQTIKANVGQKIYKDIVNEDDINNLKNGDFIYELIDSINEEDLGNINRNTIDKIYKTFKSKINEVEKDKEFDIFKNKQGKIVSGIVSRIENGNIIVNLELGEGFLSKHEIVQGEIFPFGSQVQALIYSVQRDPVKYQVLLTRSRVEFLEELIKSMIPEIESGLIEIKAIARDIDRSKVAVYSQYPTLDPVGICIGRDGSRIKNLRSVINERIDIVRWDEDMVKFLSSAISPIEASKFIFHSDDEVELVLDAENMNKAKSHRRQQIKLASKLTKYKIRIISKEENEENMKLEYENANKLFSKIDLTNFQIRLLLGYGISCLEDLIDINDSDLINVLSENEEFVQNLKEKARQVRIENIKDEYYRYGIDTSLLELENCYKIDPYILHEYKIHNMFDFANLDSDEVYEILKKSDFNYGVKDDVLYKIAENFIIEARSKKECT